MRVSPRRGTRIWKIANAMTYAGPREGKDDKGMEREEVGDDPGEDRSVGCSGCSSEPNDGTDAGGGDNVGRRGEEIGRPALMRGGGEAEESDGGPGVMRRDHLHVGNEHDGQHAQSADEQGELAPGVDAMPVLHAEAGEPSTRDGAYRSGGIDDDERIFGLIEVEAIVVVEKHGR